MIKEVIGDNNKTFKVIMVLIYLTTVFSLFWNVHETRINRENGYKNRAVTCATTKGAIEGLAAQHQTDSFLADVYRDFCANEPNIYERYPNVSVGS